MARYIDYVDEFIDELIDANPGAGIGDLTFNAPALQAWLLAHADTASNGWTWPMPEVSSLLQEHGRMQNSTKPPLYSCYTLNRGANALWGIGHPGAVTFITGTAISRAATDAITRITNHAQPAALGDPRATELIEIAQGQIESQLGGLAKMLAMLP
ncbi:MAG: hypothetical protein ABIQ39_05925 [Ilumatobacteraceae bacterium]